MRPRHQFQSRPDGPSLALVRAQALLASLAPGGEVTPIATGVDIVDTTVPVPMLNGLVLTASRHDRAGLDRALLLHRLTEGRRAGAHTAYLQSSEMGRPLHEKLGFLDGDDDIIYFTH